MPQIDCGPCLLESAVKCSVYRSVQPFRVLCSLFGLLVVWLKKVICFVNPHVFLRHTSHCD